MAPSRRAATSAAGGQLVSLDCAGLQLRVVAFALDILVLVSFGMLFAAAAIAYAVVDYRANDDNLSDSAEVVLLAVAGIYVLLFLPMYHVIMWAWRGQTVGKMAVRIKVLSRDGGRVSLGRSSLRLLGYLASVAPLFLGIVIALFDSENRTLHDRLAGTVVVELP